LAKKKYKVMPFFKYLTLVMIIITLITLGLIRFIDILPNEYFWVLFVLLIVITFINSALILAKKGNKKRIFGTLFSILYIIFLVLGIVYELNTINFLKKLGYTNFKTENYSVIILNNNNIQINDMKSMGSLSFHTDGLNKAKEKIEKKFNWEFKTYEDVFLVKKDFLNASFEGLLIENSILAILNENDTDFSKKYRVIYEFAVDVPIDDISKEVDITKDSFNIFITGIDTYGPISSVARSDVNMILTINPRTHKVHITSIPRDYYIKLATKGEYDKFTHSGIYGTTESVKSLEEFLDIKINYYVKLNFTSMIKVIDALNGINVYSKYSFTSRDGYIYQEGYNYLNGEEALSFVRERKAFPNGDRVRILNQSAMAKAIIDKVTSPSIIKNYNELLKSLSDAIVTNMSKDTLTKFIKKEASEMNKWETTNYSLDGSDSYQYTYSYKGSKLYVMVPNMDTVINAKNKINEVLK